MKLLFKLTILMVLISGSCLVFAKILLYQFDDQVKEERFYVLIKELRCPKCQNNNLADSNSPLSEDMKNIIYEKVKAGKTDDEIVMFLKERYGDFISYRPPVKPSTWLIWYGPFIILLAGLVLIFRFVSGRQKEGDKLPDKGPSISSEKLLAKWREEVEAEDIHNIDNNSEGDSQ